MENFQKMSGLALEIAESIDSQLHCYNDLMKKGVPVGEMKNCVRLAALKILDYWTPQLSVNIKEEVIIWFFHEYGIFL